MDASAYKNYKLAWTGVQSIFTGIVVICLLLFVGGRAIRNFGWTVTALITPIAILVTGLPFMAISTVNYYFSKGDDLLIANTIVVAFGFLAVYTSKALKYSFFDPTKEMAYIPLDDDLKSKGKAAVDVVGGRLGKSGSGLIQLGLLLAIQTSSIRGIVLIITVLLGVAVTAWIFAAIALGHRFKALSEKPKEAIAMA